MASMSRLRWPMMRRPHHTPAKNVSAVIKIIITNKTSTVMANQCGNVFINVAIDSSIMLCLL